MLVLPTVLTIGAAVALTVHAVTLVLLLYGRTPSVNVAALVRQLEKLLRADNASRAVKLCNAIGAASPARRLTLLMLGLELPAASVADGAASDYRAAPPVTRFEDVVRETVGGEAARLRAALWPYAIAGVGSGIVAAVAGGAARFLGAQQLSIVATVVGVAGALGTAFAVSQAHKMLSGIGVIRDALLPLLLPVEEMTSDRREAAAAARELLAAPDTSASKIQLIVAIVLTAAGAGAIGFVAFSGDEIAHAPRSLPPTLAARVTSTVGNAPVGRGTSCTMLIESHDSAFNCHIDLRCGDAGTGLYGTTPDMGYTHCLWDGTVAMSALDERYDEGDPALRFDRRSRFLEVRGATWTVTLEVEPDPPDAGSPDATL